ncbi:hypothetical protein TWF694_005781 [Orbilia ellipsospora]|uniref:Uncharacterized protein n=1 Tax=Orbilia ellipsospora TaxID=2528407 RepID=A0AAV9WY03_9PEZI
MTEFQRRGQLPPVPDRRNREYPELEATASTPLSYQQNMPTPPTSPSFSRKPAPTHETAVPERTPNAESDFRRRRADFYRNSIPLARRNGDLEAVEIAYNRLIRLAEIQPSTVTSTVDDNADKVSTLHLSLAANRQASGKWQTALDALDRVNEGFLASSKEHAVSYWHVKALVYLGLEQIDSAEEAATRALDIARDIAERGGERSRNTSYFIMAIIMAIKEDRMEAAFYKSLVRESGDLDEQILERQWKAFDAIDGDFGVRVASKRGLGVQAFHENEGEDEASNRSAKSRKQESKLDQTEPGSLNSTLLTEKPNKVEMRQLLKPFLELYTPLRGIVAFCCLLFLLIVAPYLAFIVLFWSVILGVCYGLYHLVYEITLYASASSITNALSSNSKDQL